MSIESAFKKFKDSGTFWAMGVMCFLLLAVIPGGVTLMSDVGQLKKDSEARKPTDATNHDLLIHIDDAVKDYGPRIKDTETKVADVTAREAQDRSDIEVLKAQSAARK